MSRDSLVLPPFYLWCDLLNDGGIATVSTYEKYNGGLSPRDVLALTRMLTCLASYRPRRPITARAIHLFQPEDWDNHLILIGGLLSNQVTRELTRDTPLRGLRSSFILQREVLRDMRLMPGRDCLTPTYSHGLETNVAGVEVDYGLIARQRNPLNLQKSLYL